MDARPYRRAVSGEIVTADQRQDERRGGDVVDAEFETVATAAGAAPVFPSASSRPARGLGVLERGRASARLFGTRGGAAFWTAGLAAAGAAFWIAGGHALVSNTSMPGQASRLRVTSFESRIEEQNGRRILALDGELANDGAHDSEVPLFSIRITTAGGGVARHVMDADRGLPLAPGGRYRFASRLVAPEETVEKVTITLESGPKA